MISPKAIIEGYQKVFKLVSLNGWKQARRDDKERDKVFRKMFEILMVTRPEFVAWYEKEYGYEPGGIQGMIDDGNIDLSKVLWRL